MCEAIRARVSTPGRRRTGAVLLGQTLASGVPIGAESSAPFVRGAPWSLGAA